MMTDKPVEWASLSSPSTATKDHENSTRSTQFGETLNFTEEKREKTILYVRNDVQCIYTLATAYDNISSFSCVYLVINMRLSFIILWVCVCVYICEEKIKVKDVSYSHVAAITSAVTSSRKATNKKKKTFSCCK